MNRRSFLLYSLSTSALIAYNPDMKIKKWTLGKYGDFYFKQMNKNLFVMHGVKQNPNEENMGFIHNVVLIESKNSLIVIDPGGYNIGLHVEQQISNISKKPIIAIFNTHDHDDHWFANSILKDAYPDAKIYAHKLMISAAKELYGGDYENYGFSFKKAKKISFPEVLLDDGDSLNIDGEEFYIQHPKNAHTNNDITITHKNTNTIIMGDLLFEQTLANFGLNSSISGNIAFLDKIDKQQEYKLYIPGHGYSGDKKTCFEPYYKFMSIIRDEVINAHKNDISFASLHVVKEKILERLAFEENLNFSHAFIDRYVSNIYNELDEEYSFS